MVQLLVLTDNPLLALLGRSGRPQVVEVLRRSPQRTWSVRELAVFAMVDAMSASRCVKELAALGAVQVTRPGRNARVRFEPRSPAGAWLAALDVPDLRGEVARTFAAAYGRPPGVLRVVLWRHPDDDPLAPRTPARLAILVSRDEAGALDVAGPALDAVRAAGLPAPDVAAFARSSLAPQDPVAAAVLAGTTL